MALSDFTSQLDALLDAATEAFRNAGDADALEAARIEFLGAKNGRLKAVQKGMGRVDKVDKPAAGKRLNEVKQAIEAAFQEAQQSSSSQQDPRAIDITLPGVRPLTGGLHPITQTIDELKDIMGRLGFTVAYGPEIEDDYHNFKALNIPDDHPARDPRDNFYLRWDGASAAMLLRSQTSTVQIRVMEHTPPPVRVIALGRVYRPDPPDRTHYPMFHQMEGLMVEQGVTMADLKTVLRMFAVSYLGADVDIRFRPSFFPFTEPSVEVDFHWNGAWMEFGGAGMVDPNVLRAVGYDPESVTGFAFGLGVERLCMRRHNIEDIRNLYNGDVRFLAQFA